MSDYAKYTKQVNMVLDYINAHINEDLDIKSLAQNTYLSTYHFHRIFTAAMGKSLAKYVMRRRLELATIQLRNDVEKPIMNIAFECGFNSVNVFCRNFKKHFGMTAEAYRSKWLQENSKKRTLEHIMSPQSRSYSHYFCTQKTFKIGGINMNCSFEIKRLDAIHVVYCRHYGAYSNMQQAFEKLMRWAYSKGLVTMHDSRLISIYHNNPSVTEEGKLISNACLVVKEPMKTDGEISSYTIPAGQYAVGKFEITWDEIHHAWECMFHLIDEYGSKCCGLAFEIYMNNPEEHPDKKLTVDICVPVISKCNI